MKKIVFTSMVLCMACFAASAQCDIKTKWTASATEFIKPSGDVQSKPGTVTVISDKENFMLSTSDGEEEMKGGVTDFICNWKDSLNGSISFKAELADKSGRVRHATVTIEATNGKTTILLAATEEATKIRLPIEHYEQVQ